MMTSSRDSPAVHTIDDDGGDRDSDRSRSTHRRPYSLGRQQYFPGWLDVGIGHTEGPTDSHAN